MLQDRDDLSLDDKAVLLRSKDTTCNCLALIEYYRTKGLSAFNFRFNPKRKVLNQWVIQYTFEDGSMLKVNDKHNVITVYNIQGYAFATRSLFGYDARLESKQLA